MQAQSPAQRTEYFPAIDGLRTVAVLVVLAFHLGAWPPAGFVGVDVFFVISGFVVASAAAAQRSPTAGRFLMAFYARRVLRIVPALLACLLVTFAAMILLVPIAPEGWLTEPNTMTGIAAFVGASNVVLGLTANSYWAPRTEFNPFTHTWSLGVEEQFYLVFPLLLFLWARGRRQLVWLVLTVAAAASLSLAAHWGNSGKAVWAFYMLPTRFWELAAGCALFMAMSWWRPALAGLNRLPRTVLAAAGLAGILTSVVVADSAHFPWPWALLPVLSAALLIVAAVACQDTRIVQWLASRPMVWMGRRSYALYLWHWPVIVLLRWTVELDSPWVKLAAAAVSVALAEASMRWVEWPTRQLALRGQMQGWGVARVLTAGASAIAVGGILTVSALALRPALTLSVTGNADDWSHNTDLPAPGARCGLAHAMAAFHGGLRLDFAPLACAAPHRTLFVLGDSHAGAYLPLLKSAVYSTGTRVILLTKPGCPVFGLRLPVAAEQADCSAFVDAGLRRVMADAKAGDTLFLPGLRVSLFRQSWDRSRAIAVADTVDRQPVIEDAVARLSGVAAFGVHVLFEAPKPVFKSPPFRCSDWFNAMNPICADGMQVSRAEMESARQGPLAAMAAITARLSRSGGRAAVWDPLPTLCGPVVCDAYRAGRPLFFDGDHLSGFGNRVLITSFMQALKPP